MRCSTFRNSCCRSLPSSSPRWFSGQAPIWFHASHNLDHDWFSGFAISVGAGSSASASRSARRALAYRGFYPMLVGFNSIPKVGGGAGPGASGSASVVVSGACSPRS